ncbi:MAG: BamA/TamA family outer membrane protein [Candidatus Marinimicrobia bacterium]|nr:BamA/TamA family outer membrane protein [Candidatus Neomarinimicrobiota bacterium]
MILVLILSICLEGRSQISDSTYFGNIEISTEKQVVDLETIVQKYKDQEVTQESYNNLTGDILLNLKLKGYYFAILNLENTNIYTQNDSILLNPKFDLDYNEKVKIDTFYFSGLEKTEPEYLVRELQNYQNQTVSDRLTRRIRRRINALQFLELNGNADIVQNRKNQFGLLLPVKEKNNNNFQGIAGYVPGKGRETGYFTGKFDIALSNLSGKGRRLHLNWSRLNQNSQEFHIEFYTPWIWHFNYSGQINFDQTLRDTILVSRSINISLGKHLNPNLEIQISGEYNSQLPTPAGQEIYGLSLRIDKYFGLGLKFDNREALYNPRSGGMIDNKIKIGNNRSNTENSLALNYKLSSEYNYQFTSEMVANLGFNFQGKWKRGEKSNYSDYFWFGGSESMRGYPEDFLNGTRVGWATLELRWLQGMYSRLYLFYERGYLYFRENGKPIRDYPASFGVGIRLNSRAGIIGLDYAFDEDDSFSTAKIHIRFTNRF